MLTLRSFSPGAVDAVISLARYCHGEHKHDLVQFSFCLDLHWSLTCSFSCLLKYQHCYLLHFTKSAYRCSSPRHSEKFGLVCMTSPFRLRRRLVHGPKKTTATKVFTTFLLSTKPSRRK
ncbi:hypothetical protein Mapa_010123 [Marchantia paleacea]|nr:hypothetical protein Mapa_010123 [Marchantia paleacea]